MFIFPFILGYGFGAITSPYLYGRRYGYPAYAAYPYRRVWY